MIQSPLTLFTSTLLLHETSHDAVPKIIQECFRLLKPGGWMIHLDVYPFHKKEEDPLYDFLKDWEVINNNENFSGALRNMNMRKIIEDAVFHLKPLSSLLRGAAK
ncbi:MAG: hypothetical protein Ct9H90mP13_12950 [Pseudomonadota bacterium]|nr:MAG: hypothetical protein Ct9H90mP13_12950 [Pseudomonadota bacterium]